MADLPPWPVLYLQSMTHILILLVLVYGLLPRWVWPAPEVVGLAGTMARAAWTFFALGLLIHLLVALRIYEGMTLLLILGGLFALRFRGWNQVLSWSNRVQEWRLNWHTGPAALWRWLRAASIPPLALWMALPLIAALVVSAWVVFTTPLQRISPSLADAEVTIEWMRRLGNSYDGVYLYSGGVYPRGMYTFLTLVQKLTHRNPILVLQTTGPLIGFGLTAAGVAALLLLARHPLGAAVYAWLYGSMAGWLPLAMERRVSHNSQEFGMLFILPAAAFSLQYMTTGKRWQALAAAAAMGMATLTHPVAPVYTGLALGVPALALVLLLPRRDFWRRLFSLAGWSILAVVLGVLPPLGGLLAGYGWHQASFNYAQETLDLAALPPIDPLLVALGVTATLVGAAAWWWPGSDRGTPQRLPAAAALGLGVATLAAVVVTWGPRFGIPYRFFVDRGQDPTAMLAAAAAGSLWALLTLPLLRRRRWQWLPAGVTLAVMVAAWWSWPPQPVRAYHMFNDDALYQYLRIDADHASGSWALVAGPYGYTLSLGRAHHIYPHQLGTEYRFGPDGLEDLRQPGEPVKLDAYFFVDWEPPEGGALTAQRAAQREAESRALAAWISRKRAEGLPLRLVYQAADLEVWELRYDRTATEARREFFSPWSSPADRLGR